MEERYLIVGLGNPGREYEDTRHNIGFMIVKALAKKYKISLRAALGSVKGKIGTGIIREKKTLLLLPLTYVNESGQSVKKSMSYYKILNDQWIVVADDVDLPFGRIRIRSKGGSGGHKGLQSIETHLKSKEYGRMRIGVGGRKQGDLADHVLGKFTLEEQQVLSTIIDDAIYALELWVTEGVDAAMQHVNTVGEK